MFLLQVHSFIASAYFHCFRTFLLQPHGNISHSLQKISHVVQKISHGLAVCKTRNENKQNKGNRENETTINGDLRESQSVGKNEKSVKFFAATAVLHRKRAQKFVVRGLKEW